MSQALGQASRRHARQVAVFASIAFGALAASVVYLGVVDVGPTQTYYADFAYAAGLQQGAPIKVSGIKVGRIAHLNLITADASPPPARPSAAAGQRKPPVVRATLQVQKPVALYVTAQSLWSVVTTGIIGDAYLELSPGAGEASPTGTAMRGVDAPHLHHIALATQTILEHLAPLFDSGQTEAQEIATPASSQPYSEAPATRLVQAFVRLLTTHQDDLETMLHDGAETVRDLRAASHAVRYAIGDGVALKQGVSSASRLAQAVDHDYPGLEAQSAALVARLNDYSARLDAPMSSKQLQAWSADLAAVLTNAAAASSDARNVLGALADGEGSLGRALHDPSLYDDLRALMHDLRAHPYKLLWRK